MTTNRRITIEVTERDIERAIRNDSYTCVVAQAIARTIPEATRIEVDTQAIRFSVPGERRLYLTPYVVSGYVIAFDAGDPIEPFKFQLRDPKVVARNKLTEAGKAVKRAQVRASRAKKKEAPATVTTKLDQEVESVKAAYEGVAKSERTGRKAPPRVFKKKKRAYGHRVLRINEDAAQA